MRGGNDSGPSEVTIGPAVIDPGTGPCSLDTLHHDIESLKTSVRRQQYAFVGLSAVLAGMALFGAALPSEDAKLDMITCRGWQAVDQDGKRRINAATTADGSSGVSWFDSGERWRVAVVTATDGSAGLLVLGQDGKPQIEASTSAGSSTGFSAPNGE